VLAVSNVLSAKNEMASCQKMCTHEKASLGNFLFASKEEEKRKKVFSQ
jgi:hypothetical protein